MLVYSFHRYSSSPLNYTYIPCKNDILILYDMIWYYMIYLYIVYGMWYMVCKWQDIRNTILKYRSKWWTINNKCKDGKIIQVIYFICKFTYNTYPLINNIQIK